MSHSEQKHTPDIVYHYTTVDSMMKIVTSESMWATSISYLNDVSERDHYLGLVKQCIPTLLNSGKISNRAVFERLLEAKDFGFTTHPFVASFSRDSDSLPQWRSYCPNGNGVSIGFKVDCLKRAFVEPDPKVIGNLVKNPNVNFVPVEYVGINSSAMVDIDIINAVAGATLLSEQMSSEHDGNSSPADYLQVMLERRACFIKHNSFENEHEHRLLVDGVYWNLHHLQFRATRSSLVPYVAVKIPRRHSSSPPVVNSAIHMSPLAGRWDFIDRVVIGPTTNRELTIEAVRAFLRREGLHVRVEHSSVPYRDW